MEIHQYISRYYAVPRTLKLVVVVVVYNVLKVLTQKNIYEIPLNPMFITRVKKRIKDMKNYSATDVPKQ